MGDTETRVRGDAGTRGRGDGETRGRGEVTWPDGEHLLVLPDCGGGCGGGYGLRRRLVARLSGPPAAVSRPLPADPPDALLDTGGSTRGSDRSVVWQRQAPGGSRGAGHAK